jgi:RpiR family glv operon transcriptional regulator
MAVYNTLKFFRSAELMPIYDKINHSDKIYAYGTGYAQRNAGDSDSHIK